MFAPVNVDYSDSNNENKRVYNALIDVAELLLMRQAYVSNIDQIEGLASYRNERTIRRSIVSGARDGKAAEGAMKLTSKKIENIVINGKNALAPYKGLHGVNGSIEIVYIDRAAEGVSSQATETLSAKSMQETITKKISNLSDHLIKSGLRTSSSVEMSHFISAKAHLEAFESTHLSRATNGISHYDSAKLSGSLNEMMARNIHLNDVIIETIERPVLSMGRKIITRSIYVFVIADISNDVYGAVMNPDIGFVG